MHAEQIDRDLVALEVDDQSPGRVPAHVLSAARNAERAATELMTHLAHLTDALANFAQRRASERPRPSAALMLIPEQAADALAISRSGLYGLIRHGQLRTVKIGTSRRIPMAALADYLATLDAGSED